MGIHANNAKRDLTMLLSSIAKSNVDKPVRIGMIEEKVSIIIDSLLKEVQQYAHPKKYN